MYKAQLDSLAFDLRRFYDFFRPQGPENPLNILSEVVLPRRG